MHMNCCWAYTCICGVIYTNHIARWNVGAIVARSLSEVAYESLTQRRNVSRHAPGEPACLWCHMPLIHSETAMPPYFEPSIEWSRGIDPRHESMLKGVQEELEDLKLEITSQSKRNFVLEKDVRYLDSRIALLIANRMTPRDIESPDEEHLGIRRVILEQKQLQLYSNLFYLLMTEPRHIATLCSLVSAEELDMFLQTVMFTMYANQYEDFEEHLLLTVFQSVLSTQCKAATEFSSLLRANTPISRMMSMYTRRGPGQTYLKRVLTKHMDTVTSMSAENLEIDPFLVHDELVRAKEASADDDPQQHRQVQNCIQTRMHKLIKLAEVIMDDILRSIHLIPYGIRWICKQIRNLTRRKDPNVSEDALSSLIGSFFFLRYVNVAIVSPQMYLLSNESLSKNNRRTLVLLAKVFQHLVNNPAHEKGSFVHDLKPFMAVYRPRLVAFLQSLCHVGDFYDTLELYRYVDLSKQDKTLHVSVNELYFMHTLVKKHAHILAPDRHVHLGQVILELGEAPAQVERPDNYTMELTLFSRWEKPIQDLTSTLMMENNMTPSDILYIETKSLFVQILQLLPNTGPVSSLSNVAAEATKSGIKRLEHLGRRASYMLRELEELRVVDESALKTLMLDEVIAELVSLGNVHMQDKLKEDKESLLSVLEALKQHHTYLQGQFDTYQAYLQNVRLSSSVVQSSDMNGVIGVLSSPDRELKGDKPPHTLHRFTYDQWERDKIIRASMIPSNRLSDITFHVHSPSPGSFMISLFCQGRPEAFLEIDLKLDDLLEKLQDHQATVKVEYLELDTLRLYLLLDRLYGLSQRH